MIETQTGTEIKSANMPFCQELKACLDILSFYAEIKTVYN